MEEHVVVNETPQPSTTRDDQPQQTESQPEAWKKEWDASTGTFYYLNASTGESSWEAPTSETVDGDAPMHEVETMDAQASSQVNFMDAATVEASAIDVPSSEIAPTETEHLPVVPIKELAPPVSSETAESVWISQYDPTTSQVYYYNTATGESQWDRPEGFIEGIRDGKMDGAVRIQSAFRSKKARDRVKNMATTPLSSSRSDQFTSRVWRQHFDPRTQMYYYHNLTTGEVTWDKPTGDHDTFAESDRQGDSVIKIQSMFRKNAAAKTVETKKQVVRDLTSTEVMQQKLKDLMHAVDEIQSSLDAREQALSSASDHPHLIESVSSWRVSANRIRDRVLDHHHHVQLAQRMEAAGADKLATAQKFHDELAATRSECLALLRSIVQLDSYFVDVDVARVNDAFQQLDRCMETDVVTITDSKIRRVIQADEVEAIAAHVSKSLRKAMGLTDFSTGKTTAHGKIFNAWHPEVQSVMDGLAEVEQAIAHKRSLLILYKQSLVEKQEASEMDKEDQLSTKFERSLRKQAKEKQDRAKLLELCRLKWQQGLEKRREDEREQHEMKLHIEQKKRDEKERRDRSNQVDQERRSRIKLSIWEAVRAGHPVDVIRAMVFAEMQKARQNGYDFVVRTARSNRGESLVQIACWGGHTDLVEYLLDEGAALHAVDSIYNQFTLLHDAARRGHAEIIRLLISRGLQLDAVDRAGDTPLHWAVRSNHYEAVLTLLGAHVHRADPRHVECAQRAARTKNYRGRTPLQLAKSECMRRLLQAFEDGRLRVPTFRRTALNGAGGSPTAASHGHRRMTESAGGPGLSRSGSFRTQDDHKHLTKAFTTKALPHSSLTLAKEPQHGLEFDEFGVINVGRSL